MREAALDHESFQTPIRACELSRCRGMCCHDGVFVGGEERRVIAELLEGVEGDYFEEKEGRWKTRTLTAREDQLGEDYPSHFPRTRCQFLDENHHCRLQSRALKEEQHPWFWKPFPCWLHPLSFRREAASGRPVLSLPRLGKDPAAEPGYDGFASCTTCGRAESTGEPAWQVLAPELSFLSELSGRDLLRELGDE